MTSAVFKQEQGGTAVTMGAHTLHSLDEQERHIETQLNDLDARLRREYSDRNGGEDPVRTVLAAQRERFANVRVRTFLPILIERAARNELADTL